MIKPYVQGVDSSNVDQVLTRTAHKQKPPREGGVHVFDIVMLFLLRGQDLNLRPSGYEPDELPGCSTPREWMGVIVI